MASAHPSFPRDSLPLRAPAGQVRRGGRSEEEAFRKAWVGKQRPGLAHAQREWGFCPPRAAAGDE